MKIKYIFMTLIAIIIYVLIIKNKYIQINNNEGMVKNFSLSQKQLNEYNDTGILIIHNFFTKANLLTVP